MQSFNHDKRSSAGWRRRRMSNFPSFGGAGVNANGNNSNGSSGGGQGSNSVNIRLFNERVILNALRRLGQASKADLSRYVSLTNNTAGVIVKELEERRLIRSEGKRSGGRGQPATLLSLDPDGAY